VKITQYEDGNNATGTLRSIRFAVAPNTAPWVEPVGQIYTTETGETAALGAAVFLNLLTTLAAAPLRS
jgi:hypothetical protein